MFTAADDSVCGAAAPLPGAAATGWPSSPTIGAPTRLGLRAGVGRFEVDDVAKEDLSFVELVAPDDDGLERQRAFAETRDHRLAAGLDALGDGDFALARQQLDRAHLAQIHPHRIVGALAGLGLLGFGDGLLRDLDKLGIGLVVLLLLLVLVSASSSFSETLMPMSDSIAITSSICSGEVDSDGSTSLS